jgi:multidrug efflux pump subunit AcrB
MRHRILTTFALTLAVAMALSAAMAQVPMTLWSSPALMNTMILNQSTNNFIAGIERQQEERGRQATESTPAQRPTSTVVVRSGTPRMPGRMAAHYPPQERANAERTFTEALARYRKIEAQLGIPRNDLAGAVAAFLAGSYMAYRDMDVPDEDFKRLVAQLRRSIATSAAFQRASAAEKQDVYEQMAILGTCMALTRDALKAQPNPQLAADMRQAAQGYLEQFLKTDAHRIAITARGLVIR